MLMLQSMFNWNVYLRQKYHMQNKRTVCYEIKRNVCNLVDLQCTDVHGVPCIAEYALYIHNYFDFTLTTIG